MEIQEQTYGQGRIRINSSDKGETLKLKLKFAEIMDDLHSQQQVLQATGPANETREAYLIRTSHLLTTIDLAKDQVEMACLIAVKAITIPT